MEIFILDNIEEDINCLKEIIYNNLLGSIVGESNDYLERLNEISLSKPDLIILDFPNQNIKNFDIINEIKINNSEAKFIIISSNYLDNIISMAYQAGVDYYMPKPINEIQLINIIKKIKYQFKLENKIKRVQEIFKDLDPISLKKEKNKDYRKEINSILLKLGIIGERGTEDILEILKYIIENKVNIHEVTIRELCSKFTDNPKSMEQKIRRTINIALTNIASLGIEDYMNESFVNYSNTLFNFQQVKREMDYIRKKSDEKGSINMKKFLSGIAIYCEKIND